MLRQIADGVLVHQSEFMQTNSVVVRGTDGVLVVDAGVTGDELACLANDIRELGQPVVAGFSTHPHWDHLLWHEQLGAAPRYGTAACAATVRERLPDAASREIVKKMMPPEFVDRVPLELLGEITGLPEGADRVPWDGPRVAIVEHRAHAPGHAAVLIEDRGVLVAGDMLSDLLTPMLNPFAADPAEDYLSALKLLEDAVGAVDVVVPGHGSVTTADLAADRIEQDRAYLRARAADTDPADPRFDPSRS